MVERNLVGERGKKMKKLLILAMVFLSGCSSDPGPVPVMSMDASPPPVSHDPVCDNYACGPTKDVQTGEIVNCGKCESWPDTTCGDNGNPGVCGNVCSVHQYPIACTYVLNIPAAVVDEYDFKCNYTDFRYCSVVFVDPTYKPCKECGYFWCCLKGAPLLK